MGSNAMKNDIKIIKSYANESMQFGHKHNNKRALARGKEVAFAVSNIEAWIKELNGVIAKMKSKAMQLDMLTPDKFSSYDEWMREVDNITNP